MTLTTESVVRSTESGSCEVSIGFVLKILWGTKISLDGDGGFRSVTFSGRTVDTHCSYADLDPGIFLYADADTGTGTYGYNSPKLILKN